MTRELGTTALHLHTTATDRMDPYFHAVNAKFFEITTPTFAIASGLTLSTLGICCDLNIIPHQGQVQSAFLKCHHIKSTVRLRRQIKIQNKIIHLVPYNSHSFINKQLYKLKSCTAVVAMFHYASVTYTIDAWLCWLKAKQQEQSVLL